MSRKLYHLIKWFHGSKDFAGMKAGKLAIRPWLSCTYNENTLADLPSSVQFPILTSNKIIYNTIYIQANKHSCGYCTFYS